MSKICPICNVVFSNKKHPYQIYCSNSCSAKAKGIKNKVEKLQRKCLRCGTVFHIFPSQVKIGEGKFCSKECYHINKASGQINRFCEICGNSFLVSRGKLKQAPCKYCSPECRAKSQTQSDEKRTCKHCGYIFVVVSGWSKDKQFCDRKCSDAYHKGEHSPLWRGGISLKRGDNWIAQRKLAYARDGGVCQYCKCKHQKGKPRNSIHHIKPYRTFNGDWLKANDLSNLITLCASCHKKAEHGKIAVPVHLI